MGLESAGAIRAPTNKPNGVAVALGGINYGAIVVSPPRRTSVVRPTRRADEWLPHGDMTMI